MQKTLRLFALASAGALLIGTSVAGAATLFTEDFGAVTQGTYFAGQNAGGFKVTSGSIDVVNDGFFGSLCVSPETQPCLDLDGGTQGAITTAIFTLPAGAYTLSFDLVQRKITTSTTVSLGSVFTNTYILAPGDANTYNIPITVAADTTGALTFTSNTPGSIGSLIDNVSLINDSTNPGIPEPSSMALLMGSLPLAAWRLLRKKA